MPKGDHLGELEHVVLLALARLPSSDAYGMAIVDEIGRRTAREVSVGAVYSALDRMERKGLLTSEVGDPSPARGGRARRCYRLRAEGRQALMEARETFQALWAGVDLRGLDVAP
ncbi:MAG: PadR family transcriptional regulator [Gemmatimonadota bacterium]|jgi:PadR family transcriptional regulator PadR